MQDRLLKLLEGKNISEDLKKIIGQEIEERNQLESKIHDLSTQLERQKQDSDSRIKDLNSLFTVSKITSDTSKSVTIVINEILEIILQMCKYPEATFPRIILDGEEYKTEKFQETQLKISAEIPNTEGSKGIFEIHYLESIIEIIDRSFLSEGEKVITNYARELGRFIEQKRTNEKYLMIVEELNEALILEDRNGLTLYANRRTYDLLGYTEKELIGKHWSFYIAPDYVDLAEKQTATRPNGVSSTYESVHLAKDGRRIPIITSATPIFSVTGEFQGVLVLSTDITERKNTEEALRKSQQEHLTLFEESPIGVLTCDIEGRILNINKTGLKQLGSPSKEATMSINLLNFPLLIRAGIAEDVEKCIKKEEKVISERVYTSKWGKTVCFKIKIVPLFDEESQIKGVLATFDDQTNIKMAEEALIQAKLQEEHYHNMLGHFLKNDLQKIVTNLEYLLKKEEIDQKQKAKIIETIIDISLQSSLTIDTVNKIFNVIQTEFKSQQKYYNLLEMINNSISDLKIPGTFSSQILIDKRNLSVDILANEFLKEVFLDILDFVISSTKDDISIQGSHDTSHFCVTILDSSSQPLGEDVCNRLNEEITDRWEAQGHFIRLSLVSVILNHYGGYLKIHPNEPRGNTFRLYFPSNLIQS